MLMLMADLTCETLFNVHIEDYLIMYTVFIDTHFPRFLQECLSTIMASSAVLTFAFQNKLH